MIGQQIGLKNVLVLQSNAYCPTSKSPCFRVSIDKGSIKEVAVACSKTMDCVFRPMNGHNSVIKFQTLARLLSRVYVTPSQTLS